MANISITNPTILNTETADVTKLTANDNDLANGLTDGTKDIDINRARMGDGTVGLPSVSFGNDTDSGFYLAGANNVALSIGGTKVADITTGTVDFGSADVVFNALSTPIAASAKFFGVEGGGSYSIQGSWAIGTGAVGLFAPFEVLGKTTYNKIKFSASDSPNYTASIACGIYNWSGTLLTGTSFKKEKTTGVESGSVNITLNPGLYLCGIGLPAGEFSGPIGLDTMKNSGFAYAGYIADNYPLSNINKGDILPTTTSTNFLDIQVLSL